MAMTNTITIKGCLGRDAEVRSTNAGRQVASCSLAHSQGRNKDSMWLDLAAWENGDGPQGWAFRDLSSARKGQYVTVTGALTMRTWEGDNGKQTRFGITVHSIDCPPARDDQHSGGGQRRETSWKKPQQDDLEDLPF